MRGNAMPTLTLLRFTRKRLRMAISLSGAVIVILTAVVKDNRTDRLKELIGSVEATDTIFAVRTDDRDTFASLRRIEHETYNLQHPLKPGTLAESLRTWPDPHTADWIDLNKAFDQQRAAVGLFVSVNRLAHKVNAQQWEQNLIKELKADLDDSQRTLDKLGLEVAPQNYKLNEDIQGALEHTSTNLDEMNKLTSAILQDASVQLDQAEGEYAHWSVIYYCLYGFGALIGIVGILMGSGDISRAAA